MIAGYRRPRSLMAATLVALVAQLVWVDPARTQQAGGSAGSSADSFLAAARATTDMYRDRRSAIAEGYRLIGPDFPGMGEHWIHLGRLMDGRFEPGAPEILSYANLDGTVTLTGVAYAVPLAPGESPPPAPVPDAAWHFHSRTVGGESFVPADPDANAPGTRVAVLHTWVWLHNPAGFFARDNWALPFARLGLEAPSDPPLAAAKALALASGGDRFLATALSSRGLLERELSDPILGRYAERARRWARGWKGKGAPPPAALESLTEIWTELWAELLVAAGPEARAGLALLRNKEVEGVGGF